MQAQQAADMHQGVHSAAHVPRSSMDLQNLHGVVAAVMARPATAAAPFPGTTGYAHTARVASTCMRPLPPHTRYRLGPASARPQAGWHDPQQVPRLAGSNTSSRPRPAALPHCWTAGTRPPCPHPTTERRHPSAVRWPHELMVAEVVHHGAG